MDEREEKKKSTGDRPKGDDKRTHQQEKKSDRLRQEQHEHDRPDRGGPQGKKDKDFQRKF